MYKICKELSKTLEQVEQIVDRQSKYGTTKEDEKYMDHLDFAVSKSIVLDLGRSRSLQIAHHILAHYIDEEGC
ncbi:MAG: hypothetical protein K2K17_13200 [Lachnospiraceae bacterium]|nr:hypothetical protein [Lachnospiraceae bacterium]